MQINVKGGSNCQAATGRGHVHIFSSRRQTKEKKSDYKNHKWIAKTITSKLQKLINTSTISFFFFFLPCIIRLNLSRH